MAFFDVKGTTFSETADSFTYKFNYIPQVPEPYALWLFGLGVVAAWAGARRQPV